MYHCDLLLSIVYCIRQLYFPHFRKKTLPTSSIMQIWPSTPHVAPWCTQVTACQWWVPSAAADLCQVFAGCKYFMQLALCLLKVIQHERMKMNGFNAKEWKRTATSAMMCLNPSITCSFEKAGISDSAVLKGTVKLFMFQHVIVGKNGYTFCVSAPQHKWIQWGMALSRFHRRLLAQMPVNYRLRR